MAQMSVTSQSIVPGSALNARTDSILIGMMFYRLMQAIGILQSHVYTAKCWLHCHPSEIPFGIQDSRLYAWLQ